MQLTISVDEAKETEYMRRSARALSRSYRIHGFRPGKAPYNVILQRLGLDMVHAQVIEQFGDEIFEQGLKESGLEIAAQASLDEVTWDPLTFHVKVPVGPEVFLGGYRDLRIHWGVPEVTDEQVNEELLRLQKEQSEWRPDDRPAELGDQVVLSITGKVEDEVVLENTDREMVLNADSPYPVPGFAEAVVGIAPGETKEFVLNYPEDHYNAEIAGKEGHFAVTLSEIRVEVLPELDDEFAMIVGDYENLDELKTSIRSSLEEQAQKRAEEEYEEQIWEKLLETATVEYPLVMVDQELESIKDRLAQQLQQQGMDLDSYFKLANTTESAWLEEARPQAETRLKRTLILGEAIKQEEITVESAEIDAEIDELVAPLGEQQEQLREMFSSAGGRMSVAERLLSRMAIERLKAIARGEDPPKGNLPRTESAEETVDETALEGQAEETEEQPEETVEAAADEQPVVEEAIEATVEQPEPEAATEEQPVAEEAVEATVEQAEAATEGGSEAEAEDIAEQEEDLTE